MNIIEVVEKEQLDKLYKDSALTIEGLSEDSISDFVDWIKEYTAFSTEDVYVIKGYIMNLSYGLTEDNRYPNDLTIVCVMLSDLVEPFKLTLPRFNVGGRWFDDVVDNNVRREGYEAD